MRKAPHLGIVVLHVPNFGDVEIQYDWKAISELRGTFGEGWEKAVDDLATKADTEMLARLLAMGSEHSEEWWLDKSPPFFETVAAVIEALRLVFFGPEEKPDEKNPTMARQLMIRLLSLGKRGSSSVGAPMTSGE